MESSFSDMRGEHQGGTADSQPQSQEQSQPQSTHLAPAGRSIFATSASDFNLTTSPGSGGNPSASSSLLHQSLEQRALQQQQQQQRTCPIRSGWPASLAVAGSSSGSGASPMLTSGRASPAYHMMETSTNSASASPFSTSASPSPSSPGVGASLGGAANNGGSPLAGQPPANLLLRRSHAHGGATATTAAVAAARSNAARLRRSSMLGRGTWTSHDDEEERGSGPSSGRGGGVDTDEDSSMGGGFKMDEEEEELDDGASNSGRGSSSSGMAPPGSLRIEIQTRARSSSLPRRGLSMLRDSSSSNLTRPRTPVTPQTDSSGSPAPGQTQGGGGGGSAEPPSKQDDSGGLPSADAMDTGNSASSSGGEGATSGRREGAAAFQGSPSGLPGGKGRRAMGRRGTQSARDRSILRVAATLEDESRPTDSEIASEAKLSRRLAEFDSTVPPTPRFGPSPWGDLVGGSWGRGRAGSPFVGASAFGPRKPSLPLWKDEEEEKDILDGLAFGAEETSDEDDDNYFGSAGIGGGGQGSTSGAGASGDGAESDGEVEMADVEMGGAANGNGAGSIPPTLELSGLRSRSGTLQGFPGAGGLVSTPPIPSSAVLSTSAGSARSTSKKSALWTGFRDTRSRASPGAERALRARTPGSGGGTPGATLGGLPMTQQQQQQQQQGPASMGGTEEASPLALAAASHSAVSPAGFGVWGRSSAKRKMGDERYEPYAASMHLKRRAVSPITLGSSAFTPFAVAASQGVGGGQQGDNNGPSSPGGFGPGASNAFAQSLQHQAGASSPSPTMSLQAFAKLHPSVGSTSGNGGGSSSDGSGGAQPSYFGHTPSGAPHRMSAPIAVPLGSAARRSLSRPGSPLTRPSTPTSHMSFGGTASGLGSGAAGYPSQSPGALLSTSAGKQKGLASSGPGYAVGRALGLSISGGREWEEALVDEDVDEGVEAMKL